MTLDRFLSGRRPPTRQTAAYWRNEYFALNGFAKQLESRADALLLKAHFFMNAQAYEQEDCEAFCRDLADYLGKPYDTHAAGMPEGSTE